ncbi:AbrB family transcriptional regulator [Pelagibacterium sp. H642]|uniref:AbrB family transcriptional regulator n=1 Tax=Pelagibacterium sp. H642 TaxID=1881069 RepID=UPI0028159ED8|nr:AbrB family transcriptional regulator [Pelagibacterium sp. H642]WMT91460.1 AbrB family transcriptional regulator [Pelagibacterium sp. H642]
MKIALRTILTLIVSALGAYAFGALGIPGGMLMGGALAVMIASLIGLPALVPTRLRDVLFICVGLSMGASVAPDTLTLIGQWPITLGALAAELVVIVVLCGVVLRRLFKFDPGTAYLSSFPGHLSFIVALASTGIGNSRQITIIQVQRVAVLTLFAPIGALFLPVGQYSGASSEPMVLTTLAMVAAGCALVGWAFTRFKVPAAYVLGSMLFATVMKLTGNFPGALPPLFIDLTFIGMGALIGSRFAGITRAEFMQAAWGGTVATTITVAVTTLFAIGVSFFVSMPIGQLWLGLSPGGLESMGSLGIALGYDTAFIAAHHVARLLMLTFAIPLVVMLIKANEAKAAAAAGQ